MSEDPSQSGGRGGPATQGTKGAEGVDLVGVIGEVRFGEPWVGVAETVGWALNWGIAQHATGEGGEGDKGHPKGLTSLKVFMGHGSEWGET